MHPPAAHANNLKSKLFDLSQRCKNDLAFASKCAYKQLNGGQEGEVRSIELELTALHAEACRSVLDQHEKHLKDNVGYLSRVEKSQRDCLKVTLIGFHGQTIFHHPNTTCDSENNMVKLRATTTGCKAVPKLEGSLGNLGTVDICLSCVKG